MLGPSFMLILVSRSKCVGGKNETLSQGHGVVTDTGVPIVPCMTSQQEDLLS